MHKVRTTAAAIIAVAAMAVTGCATTAPEATPEEPVDITFTTWVSNEAVHDKYIALADEFREDHPELGEFKIEVIPIAEYTSQLSIRLSSGDAPDLGVIVEAAMPAWAASGALHDISSLKDDPSWEFDDIIPNLYAALEGENGELFGYPNNNTTHPIIYNKTAFEAAGLPTPNEMLESGDWTWQNLREVSKQLVDAGVVTYGFDIPQFGFKNYAVFTAFLNGFGAEAYPGGDTCGLTDPASVETFEFVHDLVYEDGTYPSPGNISSFPTGDTAMYLGPPSSLADLADSTFEYDMAPQPEGEGVEYNPFLGQSALVAWEAGGATELATALLGHITSKAGALTFANVSPRASLRTEEVISNLYPQVPAESAKQAMFDTLESAEPIDYPVAWPEIETLTRPALDGVWTPDADIEAQLELACESVESLLEG